MAALFSTGLGWLRKSLFENTVQYIQCTIHLHIRKHKCVWEYMDGEDCVEFMEEGKCVEIIDKEACEEYMEEGGVYGHMYVGNVEERM
jgi:hypothetical protein